MQQQEEKVYDAQTIIYEYFCRGPYEEKLPIRAEQKIV